MIDYQSNSASEYYEGYSAGTGDWAIIDSTGTYELMALTGNNHLQFHGTAPTISTCGTSPSVVGNDNAFTITVGTGTTTACTATFASAWTNVPQCNVTPNYQRNGLRKRGEHYGNHHHHVRQRRKQKAVCELQWL